MKCTEIGEQLMDMATGLPTSPQVEEHVGSCVSCSERLQSMRGAMAMLDEWQAPEPSPYFDSRLGARLREEAARPQGWFSWLKRPALAGALAALLIVGGLLIGGSPTHPPDIAAPPPGTAVSDLQDLDKNHELYANFDMLDDLPADQQQQETAEP